MSSTAADAEMAPAVKEEAEATATSDAQADQSNNNVSDSGPDQSKDTVTQGESNKDNDSAPVTEPMETEETSDQRSKEQSKPDEVKDEADAADLDDLLPKDVVVDEEPGHTKATTNGAEKSSLPCMACDEEKKGLKVVCCKCERWIHGACAGLSAEQPIPESYYCPSCSSQLGPASSVRHTAGRKRKKTLVELERINMGRNKNVSTRKRLYVGVDVVSRLKSRKFASSEDCLDTVVDGTGFDLTSLGFKKPILVTSEATTLGLVVPEKETWGWGVDELVKDYGSNFRVEIVDVATQQLDSWTLRDWSNYFNSSSKASSKKKVYHMSELQLSSTLSTTSSSSSSPTTPTSSSAFTPPSVVLDLDYFNRSIVQQVIDKPSTSLVYVQFGIEDSYVDFKLPASGSSAWFHVYKGTAVFYFIAPGTVNFQQFQNWNFLPKRTEIFLADKVDACFECRVEEGQTLFVPPGWIYALYTPEKSVICSGNFIHDIHVGTHLKSLLLEDKCHIPAQIPQAEKVSWVMIQNKLQASEGRPDKLPASWRADLPVVFTVLMYWNRKKKHQALIPSRVNPKNLLSLLRSSLHRLLNPKRALSRKGSTVDKRISSIQQRERAADLHCICCQPYDCRREMICCAGCAVWFHVECESVSPEVARLSNEIDWYCYLCNARLNGSTEDDFDDSIFEEVQTDWGLMDTDLGSGGTGGTAVGPAGGGGGSGEAGGLDATSGEVYCICKGPSDGFMIQCDICEEWFHGACVGLDPDEGAGISSYYCPTCR